MAAPIKLNFKVYQGSTFSETLRWESATRVYVPITNISKRYDVSIDEINDDKNHIHLLISYNPNIKVNSIVMRLKQISTYNLWLNYESYLKKIFFKERTFWSDGYFVSSIGYIDEDKIKKYIKLQ